MCSSILPILSRWCKPDMLVPGTPIFNYIARLHFDYVARNKEVLEWLKYIVPPAPAVREETGVKNKKCD